MKNKKVIYQKENIDLYSTYLHTCKPTPPLVNDTVTVPTKENIVPPTTDDYQILPCPGKIGKSNSKWGKCSPNEPCIDLSIDSDNCGFCGQKCKAGTYCKSTYCVRVPPEPGTVTFSKGNVTSFKISSTNRFEITIRSQIVFKVKPTNGKPMGCRPALRLANRCEIDGIDVFEYNPVSSLDTKDYSIEIAFNLSELSPSFANAMYVYCEFMDYDIPSGCTPTYGKIDQMVNINPYFWNNTYMNP